MVSTTFSTAAVACRRSEPNFSVSTSMSSALFMQNLRNQWSFLDRLKDTVNPMTIDFQEPRAISGVAGELSRNPLAPLGLLGRAPRSGSKTAISARCSRFSDRQSARFPVRPAHVIGLDFIEFAQRKAYIVESLEQPPSRVGVNVERHHDRSRDDIPILKIHSDFHTRMLLDELPQNFHIILRNFCRQEPRLARVAAKDVGESGRDDHPEPEVHQRPDGMLARRTGAEVWPCDQNRPLVKGSEIQNE